MANEVKILISAVDKASATLNKVQSELKQTGQTGKTSFMGMGTSALAAVGGITAVAGAAVAAAKTAKSLADQYQAYAFQVEDFGHIVGTSAEESSKLIQAADDARISISSLQVSLKQAVSKGYEPNIEGLAKLADQYNAIIDPIERSRFAMEVFGRRSGPEMVKMLELGGAKIKEMGDSIEGTARLMTEEGVQAAKDYYTAVDTLKDSWQDFTLTLGKKATPAIIASANSLNELNYEITNTIPTTKELYNAYENGIITFSEFYDLLNKFLMKTERVADITAILKTKTDEYVRSNDIAVKSTTAEAGAMQLVKEKSQGATTGITEFANATETANLSINKNYAAIMGVAGALGVLSSQQEKARKSAAKITEGLIDKEVSFKVGFQLPDISSELAAWIKSDEWRKAGGNLVLDAFVDLKPRIAGLTDADRATLARQLSALELSVKVEIGEISKYEAEQQLKNAFGGTTGEARATIKAAIEVDTTKGDSIKTFLEDADYSANVKSIIDQTTYEKLRSDLEKDAETPVKPKLNMSSYQDIVNIITTPLVIPVKTSLSGSASLSSIAKKELLAGQDLNSNGIIGGARGLSIRVPSGYPNDSFLIGATSGETVDIKTPTQQRNSSSVMVGSVNIYAQPGQSPTAIANAVLSALNKKIRANMSSGIAYAG